MSFIQEENMEKAIHEYTTLSKWGNSKATRIPTSIVKLLNIDINQKFSVSVQGHSIVLTPETKKASSIHELFADWKDDGLRHQELDWGEAKGEEMSW